MKASPRSSWLLLARTVLVILATGSALVLACASAEDAKCERNSDCDHAYCQEGACRKDCVDSELDCPKGYSCSLIGKCEFESGGAAGASGGGSGGEGGQSGGAGAAGTGGGVGGAGPAGGAGMAGAGQAGAGNGQGGAGTSQGGAGTSQGGAGTSQGGAGTSQGGAGTSAGGAGNGQGGAGNGQGGAGEGGGAPFGGGPPFGGGGDAGSGNAGSGAGGSGGSPVGTKAELDPCLGDGDCSPGLLCRADFKNGQPRCTHPCATQADCSGGRRCELIDGAQVCVMGDVGRPCSLADTCNFACLLGQKYCTSTCTTGADCPNGFACQEGVGSGGTSVCAKLEVPCTDQDASACIAPTLCDSKNQVISGCTATCNTAADCPQRAAGFPPWTCDGTVCRRPSDVFGSFGGNVTPAQYACNASNQPVSLCNDAQHINYDTFTIPNPPPVDCQDQFTTSGVEGDSCIDSCRYQGGCEWNFTCTAVGSVGPNRVGLCLLNGIKPVGSPCTSNTECDYAFCPSTTGTCSRDCTADGFCPTGSTCTVVPGPTAEGKPFRRCQ